MVGTIEIFNPKDKPFGWLSNNYSYLMRIDGIEWKTVTNYIYAKLFKNKGDQNLIRNSNISNVEELTYKLIEENKVNLDKLSYETAYLELFKQQSELAELLMNTNNVPLIYKSQNLIFGMNDKGEGKNLLGIILMQIRKKLLQENRRKQYEQSQELFKIALYEIELAYRGLLELIRNDKSTLEEYIDLNPTEIINRIGREKLKKMNADAETLYKMYQKNISDFSYLEPILYGNDINILAKMIRKIELEKMRDRLKNSRKDIAFNIYVNNILSEKYPNLSISDYELAKKQEFRNLTFDKLQDLKNRVYKLYEDRQLSSSLKDLIKSQINELNIPSDTEIEKAKSFSINYNKPLVEQKEKFLFESKKEISKESKKEENEKLISRILKDMEKFKETLNKKSDVLQDILPPPVNIYPEENMSSKQITGINQYNLLSPICNLFYIKIGEKIFPTVLHYVIFKRLISLVKKSIDNIYNEYIRNGDQFVDINVLSNTFRAVENQYYDTKIQENARISMNKKFENRLLQDLLLSTGNLNILYGDKHNILGVGMNKKGENFVGKYLDELRNKILEQRKDETIQKITENDITDILENDGILKTWVLMRVNDMCNIIDICYKGLYGVSNIFESKDVNFVRNILDKVYNPCVYLYSMTSEVTATIPEYFKNTVNEKLGGYKLVEIKKDDEDLDGERDDLLDKLIKKKRNQDKTSEFKKEKVIVSDDIIELLWKRIVVVIYYLIKIKKDMNINDIKTILAQLELLVSSENIVECLDFSDCIEKAIINLIQSIKDVYSKNTTNSDILKIDEKYIELALNIILTKKVKLTELEKIQKIEEKEEELEIEIETEEDEIIEREDKEDEVDEDDIPAFEPRPTNVTKLNRFSEIKDIENIEDFKRSLNIGIQIVKNYKMSETLKKNRINFFASR